MRMKLQKKEAEEDVEVKEKTKKVNHGEDQEGETKEKKTYKRSELKTLCGLDAGIRRSD